MDIFEQIANSKPAGKSGGPYFQLGRGVAIVKGFRQGETFRKEKIFVADYQIESSVSVPGAAEQANAPGTSAAYVQNLSKFPDNAPSNAKSCVLAALASEADSTGDLENLTKEQLAYALGKDNPCRGIRIAFEVRQVRTKKGGTINVVDFAPIPGQSDDDIAGRRKMLDTGEAYSTTIGNEA